MLVRAESKIQERVKLQPSGQRLAIARLWIILAFLLLILWLIIHYLLRPNWINALPSFITGSFALMEGASALTLGIIGIIYLWWQRQTSLDSSAPTLDELLALSPADFERYVANLFRKKGYKVKLRGRKGDRGVDLELARPGGRTAIVQCKRYKHTIGPDIVRELFGTMVHERVHHAFLVTTADISDAAKDWAQAKPITLIDGPALLQIARSLNKPSRSK